MKICNKKMEYAHMELNGKMFLISAEEFSLCDKYMRYARNKDRGIKIIEPEEGNPLKIVYGMMLVNPIFDTTEAFKIADNVKNYSLFDISENNVNVSAYEDILFCMDYSKRCAGCEGYELDCASTEMTEFPFAANLRKIIGENTLTKRICWKQLKELFLCSKERKNEY